MAKLQQKSGSKTVHHLACLLCALLMADGVYAATSMTAYQQGVAAYNRKDYMHAYAWFETALRSSPNDLNSLYYDAITLHRLKKWSQASQRYKQVVNLYPDSSQAKSALQVLKMLDPSFTPEAATTPKAPSESAGATISGIAALFSGAASDEDMSGLPDKASFYFKKTPDGHMAVNLMFNNHPIDAWFDTGAGCYFYRDQLKAAGVDTSRAVTGGVARGWAGTGVQISRLPAEIKLGTLTRHVTVALEDTSTSLGQNLVGQDLLRGYQYAIDDKAHRVDLVKVVSSEQKTDPLYDVPCVRQNGHDHIQIEINGRKADAFIDTGSDATIVDPQTAAALKVEDTGQISYRRGVGADWTAHVGYAKLRVGPIVKDNWRVLIGGNIGNCIGQDFMSGWRCTVDRRRNLLHFFH